MGEGGVCRHSSTHGVFLGLFGFFSRLELSLISCEVTETVLGLVGFSNDIFDFLRPSANGHFHGDLAALVGCFFFGSFYSHLIPRYGVILHGATSHALCSSRYAERYAPEAFYRNFICNYSSLIVKGSPSCCLQLTESACEGFWGCYSLANLGGAVAPRRGQHGHTATGLGTGTCWKPQVGDRSTRVPPVRIFKRLG